MLWMNLHDVDTIHPQNNKIIIDVKVNATGDSMTALLWSARTASMDVGRQV